MGNNPSNEHHQGFGRHRRHHSNMSFQNGEAERLSLGQLMCSKCCHKGRFTGPGSDNGEMAMCNPSAEPENPFNQVKNSMASVSQYVCICQCRNCYEWQVNQSENNMTDQVLYQLTPAANDNISSSRNVNQRPNQDLLGVRNSNDYQGDGLMLSNDKKLQGVRSSKDYRKASWNRSNRAGDGSSSNERAAGVRSSNEFPHSIVKKSMQSSDSRRRLVLDNHYILNPSEPGENMEVLKLKSVEGNIFGFATGPDKQLLSRAGSNKKEIGSFTMFSNKVNQQ